jgi:hypothetical protein
LLNLTHTLEEKGNFFVWQRRKCHQHQSFYNYQGTKCLSIWCDCRLVRFSRYCFHSARWCEISLIGSITQVLSL